MKKLLILVLVLLLIPFGCEKREKNTLDTSNLKKSDQSRLTKEQRKVIPITYESSSLEEGLEALPFTIKIPNKLPFKVKPIESLYISDVGHNGKKLNVSYMLSHFSKSKFFGMNVTIYNYKPELESELESEEPNEIVQLKDGVSGTYTGISSSFGVSYKLDKSKKADEDDIEKDLIQNTLVFEKGGLYYELAFVANNGTAEQIKRYVTNIANQMM
ncbi:hypothetical protein [Gottfriedia solisilvae]|uniref:hypothetical protein n=1 Tax=Gottfriedia solisilvae TaxID=1516104 RepID=UPI003D2F10A0